MRLFSSIILRLGVKVPELITRKNINCTSKNFDCPLKMELHHVCRNKDYWTPSLTVSRIPVPDHKVLWSVEWEDYYTVNLNYQHDDPRPPWCDPEIRESGFFPLWNAQFDGVNRRSHNTIYEIVDGCPRNPMGRTGLRGKGMLGKWGPNHAADIIVTRWKEDPSKQNERVVNPRTGLPVLEFIAIQRRSGDWALPGGMIDRHESPDVAAKREFAEEVLAVELNEVPAFYASEVGKKIEKFFEGQAVVYKGYVDDPRNTDNAWMETIAFHKHIDKEDTEIIEILSDMIKGGDDAVDAQWAVASSSLRLYASHAKIIYNVISAMNADW